MQNSRELMEDSFRCRVDRVFGSLGNTASSVAFNPSLWSLSDEEIERREWHRSKDAEEEEEEEDDDESEPSGVRSQLQADLQGLSDDEVENEEIDGAKRRRQIRDAENVDDEHWDVQSNIGRDCTLDFEEEEDEYDKLAVGMEQTGDQLYMRDIKFADYGIDEFNSYGELPNSFQVARDPRANHMAAKIRLKEDAEAAGNFYALQLSAAENVDAEDFRKGELDGDNPKSILKRRENLMDFRSHKRVRFMVDPNENCKEQLPSGASAASEACLKDENVVTEKSADLSQFSHGVPDYLRNPSKYKHYTFDSSEEMNDQSNQRAYMEFFHSARHRHTDSSSLDETSLDTPKSLIFIPRRKPYDDWIMKRSESKHTTGDSDKNRSFSLAVAVEDTEESEISAMEEDDLWVDKGCSLQKPGRQYRSRSNANLEDNST